MTPESARFLLDLLDRQTVTIGHDGAEDVIALAFQARRELLDIVEPTEAPG